MSEAEPGTTTPRVDERVGEGVTFAPMRWWHIPDALAIDRQLFGAEAWSARLLWSELAQALSRHYLVVLRSGEIIGYGGLAAHADEAFIQTIGVRTDQQRQGIGTALLRALLAEADRRGARTVLLEVRVNNPVARRLYERHGFVQVRIRRGYYQPSGTDAVEMRRG